MNVTNNWIMAPSEVFEEYGYIVGEKIKNGDRLLSNGQWVQQFEFLGSIPAVSKDDKRLTNYSDEAIHAFIAWTEPSEEV